MGVWNSQVGHALELLKRARNRPIQLIAMDIPAIHSLEPEENSSKAESVNLTSTPYRLLRFVHELRFSGTGPSRLLFARFLRDSHHNPLLLPVSANYITKYAHKAPINQRSHTGQTGQ